MKARTTITLQPTLFDQILQQSKKEEKVQEKQIKINIKSQQCVDNTKTKSLHNLNDIFYSKELDYDDYKQSLKYNNKNLKKIALENISNPHPKLLKNLLKVDLCGLIELKIKDLDIKNHQFDIFKKGINKCFPKLKILQLNCPELSDFTKIFQGPQELQFLDIGSTQINDQGLCYICQQKWPYLETLVLQWCSKLNNIDQLGINAQNFQSLKILDVRFTRVNNDTIGRILNSELSFSLQSIRLFGTQVEISKSKWKSDYIVQQLAEAMRGKKLKSIKFDNSQTCQQSGFDRNQVRIKIILSLDANDRHFINLSWNLTFLHAQIQLFDLCEYSLADQNENYVNLFEFFQKEWQLRDSLNELNLPFTQMQLTENSATVVLNTLSDWKELRKLQLTLSNQYQLKPITYYHLLTQVSKLKEIQFLSLDFTDNKIVLNNVFFDKLLRALQSLEYLNNFSLSILNNIIHDIQDVKLFNYQLITSLRNPMLNHILLIETLGLEFNYELQDLLYLCFHRLIVNINLDQNLMKPSKLQSKFQLMIRIYRNRIQRLLRSLYIAQHLNFNKRFRQEIIYEIIEYL